MPEDRSKIQLKKAADGTITKTVIKKIVKKVRLKKIEEKPPVKAVPPAAVQPPKTPVKPPIRPAPRPDYRNQGARPQRPGDNTRYPQNRPYDRDAAGKKKIFIARGPAARPGQTAPASPIQDKQKIAEKRKHKLKDRDKDKFSHEDSLEKHLYYHKKDRDEKEIFSNVPTSINIMEKVPIKVFAHKLNVKANEIIKKLMSMGLMVTINDTIDAESASIVAQEFKCEVKVTSLYEQTIVDEDKGSENDYGKRDPIVTVMGHVDHGKTQLLDSIRKTNVIATESGGITQHIGAYKVSIPQGGITFIDTPGHEAFTAMRARGAKITDIVILVVAADDGIMPQTIEALNHAREAKVPVIVAINKIDKPEANIERVKKQLAEHNLLAEDWGGDTIIAPVSALKHQGIDKLLESILLVAEMHEYKGNPKVRAKGTVIESKIEQGKGTVVTVVIQNGTLHIGDPFVCGIYSGKVRAMFDEHSNSLREAPPSTPVEIIGIENVPEAGDPFHVLSSEKETREIASRRQLLLKEESARDVKKVTLTNLFETIKESGKSEFKVVVKADVFGSVEAIKDYLGKLITEEAKITVIQAAAGAINESDILLASASKAIIIGFKVRPNTKAKLLAEREHVEVRIYNIIYDIIDDMKKALTGLLSPETSEKITGQAEVRQVFKISKIGTIAGCYVTSGAIERSGKVRLIRDNVMIYQGKISSLRRFKDDAREVKAGFECGIGIENYPDLREKDIIECFTIVEKEKQLELTTAKPENSNEQQPPPAAS